MNFKHYRAEPIVQIIADPLEKICPLSYGLAHYGEDSELNAS